MEQRELGWMKRMEGEKVLQAVGGKIDLSQGLTLESPFTLLPHGATIDYSLVSISSTEVVKNFAWRPNLVHWPKGLWWPWTWEG
jgi:hypothetical protein